MYLLSLLGQGVLMIYRLYKARFIDCYSNIRLSWMLPLIIGLTLFVCLVQQVADS